MKKAVGVSLGSSRRDFDSQIDVLGETVHVRRIGTDGDRAAMTRLFSEMDGTVDAFGLGGADIGLQVGNRKYTLRSVSPLIAPVKVTPLVDGSGLKNTLERAVAQTIEDRVGATGLRRVLLVSAADRWGMATSFIEAGYEVVFGDLMFGLDLPIPIHTVTTFKVVTTAVMPIVCRLPFEMLYPTGDKQDLILPKFGDWYDWATVIAGDCHFIKQHLPDRLHGKIVCTNTTTAEDVALFQSRGVDWLVTTTPRIDGRTFGTNILEAALVAASGLGRTLSEQELGNLIAELEIRPSAIKLGL